MSCRVGPLRWDDDGGPVDSLWPVGVADAAVVALVQQEGASSDDCSDGKRKSK